MTRPIISAIEETVRFALRCENFHLSIMLAVIPSTMENAESIARVSNIRKNRTPKNGARGMGLAVMQGPPAMIRGWLSPRSVE